VVYAGYLSREEATTEGSNSGFIGCYGDVRGTDMESLLWSSETGRACS